MEKKEETPKTLIAQTTPEIISQWNSCAPGYSDFMAKNFEALGLHLFNMAGGYSADSILDLGCGEGTIALNIALSKKAGATLLCSDIAEEMLKIVAGRFDKLEQRIKDGTLLGYKQDLIFGKGGLGEHQIIDKEKGRSWTSLGVEVKQADNEDLSKILPNGAVMDCIIANLSLHIVNDPNKMLKECHRVLKTGGRAVFTVWGSDSLSYFFTIQRETKKKFQTTATQSTTRDLWHLKDKDSLVKMLEQTGFGGVLAWEQFVAYLPMDDERRDNVNKEISASIAPEGTEIYTKALEYMREEVRRVTKGNKLPLGLNVLCVLGTKL